MICCLPATIIMPRLSKSRPQSSAVQIESFIFIYRPRFVRRCRSLYCNKTASYLSINMDIVSRYHRTRYQVEHSKLNKLANQITRIGEVQMADNNPMPRLWQMANAITLKGENVGRNSQFIR